MITLTKEQRIAIVQYRMENANNTLKEVESHIQNGFYNMAVNRMYYACYYAASANGVETKSHDGVRRMVGQELILKGIIDAEYGRFYSQLFSKRETGDYEDFINHDLKTVESLFPVARSFVSIIENCVSQWLTNQV